MKKKLLIALSAIGFGFYSHAQISEGGKPFTFAKILVGEENPFDTPYDVVTVAAPDMTAVDAEDNIAAVEGKGAYRIGINISVNINMMNSGTWMDLPNGDRLWRVGIKSSGAAAITLYFGDLVQIPAGGKLFAYNERHSQYVGAFTNNTPGFYALEMIQGEMVTLEYLMPASATDYPVINVSEIAYIYRGVGERIQLFAEGNPVDMNRAHGSCEVDVACSEINGWTAQRDAVVRYTFVSGGTYLCSGAMINNTSNDCTPYFLTANHCGEPTTSSAINNHVFYFNYQRPTCSPGNTGSYSGAQSQTMSGGTLKASSANGTHPAGSGSQVDGCDFVLIQMSTSVPGSYNPYYAGWNRNTSASPSGVGIHHPAGDEKKISTYSSSLSTATYNGGWSGAHWSVNWVATANGHGVTEGGSSGSPIYDNNGYIVGHLSGGSSYCSTPNSADLYGKFLKAWDQDGTTNNSRLKPWLDPGNTNTMTLSGTYAPCSPQPPIADFVASATQVTPGTTVNFTDLSTNSPTGWTWSISPATGWSYAGGTNSSSQNPQITFNTVGFYTISLTASNTQGSDSEIKTNYIEVANSVGPCAATSTNCSEYIGEVNLNTINNTTACTNYGDYTSISTTLVKGQSYCLTVAPEVGGSPGAYSSDEIAAWIDYNDDGDFNDAGEQVGYLLISGSFSPVFNFTVPMSAVTGDVTMRCRISYQPDDGPIDPCGTTQWGEVEDYTITISEPTGSAPTADFVADQTTVPVSSTVNFTDLSTNSPTSWTWTVSPSTGWSFTGGTNSTSQNPKINFTAAGTYTVNLTASNGNGSDNETKTNYITVNADVTGIQENLLENIWIYPNPVEGILTVNLALVNAEVKSVQLLDVTGRVVATGYNNNGVYTFDMNAEASGVYFVNINTSLGSVTKKVTRI
ncbi:MAG: PKD domain-containing protein [Crocinitomicaceae bacterium]|nr:PKD domain-containing protein [Crocinitomicaceae bacterium]